MFRIKKLDIFIAKQFGLLFVGTFFICQFVLMMQFLWRYIDTLVGKGLSMDVLAEFFWYMGLMLVPQALPLAILLSSLITFGNMGESSELTAIKAAGISLMQAFRSLIAISILICFTSLYFQNTIGPNANRHLMMMLLSMKQKSPELEIPEGIFYDGIPNSNIYVQKKDLNTGKLYGIMIYRMTGSYEDQAIILADSGMLQATAEKKHLLMTLWNGEWFENMQAHGDFNKNDGPGLSNNAKAKGFAQITHDKDSISAQYDSIGRAYYNEDLRMVYALKQVSKKDSLRALALANTTKYNVDSAFARLSTDAQRSAISYAQQQVRTRTTDLDFKQMMTSDGDRIIRQHEIEWFSKISLALTCLVFFFIGGPLGAIIRKGGLGLPVLISVIVFIVFYILDNTGQTMAKKEMWTLWFGLGLAPTVLIPMAIFFTYKATNDSVVFNVEVYTDLLRRFLGLRIKRHVARKEVIINDPDYASDYYKLKAISEEVTHYSEQHNLKHAPNWVRVFFRYEPDHAIAGIYEQLEKVIEDLSNSRDRTIINHLSVYPIVSVKAHTRPFERKWLNIVSAALIPLGFVLYLRMWRYRLRLLRDLRTIKAENDIITERIRAIAQRDGLTL